MDASHHGMGHRLFCISEYYFENQRKDWVQGKSYECPSSEELTVEEPVMRLYACDGFLMVIVYHGKKYPCFWLLDLSTSKWSNITEKSKSEGVYVPAYISAVCRAFWNVIP